ncbi:hypothetical protein AC629_25245 [Bradyrhizobium sp. NAS80.1]|uniref:hypothetical protein n=1 Tax=Bradyrhizobium sp. NAS80.1 TaxID=1680159 RepID=UPI00096989A0|nr:hypothetical protein [Bradyrhizobium sp. NAS80.1]OKO81655.1 hypothetical protein AC629_25245 [Bradyrhizobium sp. NAS80.1]
MKQIYLVTIAMVSISACVPSTAQHADFTSPPYNGAMNNGPSQGAPAHSPYGGKMSPAGVKLLADTEKFRAKCGAKAASVAVNAGKQVGQTGFTAGMMSMATGGLASPEEQIRNKARADVLAMAAAQDCP